MWLPLLALGIINGGSENPPEVIPTPSYSQEVTIKPFYVKRNKKIYLFNTAIEADEFLEAEKIALEAIEKAQKTSKRAKKRFKEKVYPVADSIDLIEIERLTIQFDIQYEIPLLFKEQDYFELMRIAYIIKQGQEDEEIEILLMACI